MGPKTQRSGRLPSMRPHPCLCAAQQSLLLVVDPQEKMMPTVADAQRLVDNIELLVHGANAAGVPILATVQNSTRLGGLVEPVAALLQSRSVVDKMTFSAVRDQNVVREVEDSGRRQIVICGIETHICVLQTAADLLEAGYQVHVVADAVSSRTVERHKLGMERIRDLGILPAATESIVFEWLERAGTDAFRSVLPFLRNR